MELYCFRVSERGCIVVVISPSVSLRCEYLQLLGACGLNLSKVMLIR